MIRILRTLLFAGMAMLATSGSGSGDARFHPPSPSASAGADQDQALSIMTYNVKGLPWPVAMGRGEALERIAARLTDLRRAGRQPHVILLQEAFSSEAASLATRAGYRHVAVGPDADLRTATAADASDIQYIRQARWDRGEQLGKQVGSGLMILSDYPITGADRMAFPDFACAGFDCLANKGVLIAHLDVPGCGRVSIVNAHLNARKAAMVPVARSARAYRRQVELMARFVARHVPRDRTLILGGDMNIGHDPNRRHAYFDGFARAGLPFITPALGGAQQALNRADWNSGETQQDLVHSVRHGKDWLFARDGGGSPLPVLDAEAPFGSEGRGEPLSDHIGYVIHYGATARGAHERLLFTSRDPMPARMGQR
ncbi:MAG TPA: endonuclease/exonuclease/phosphatase family protein [Sphingobium sp.]|nr:endonuclease/exonuclease/phosphatase family protein [Sphingobium sp.]